MLMSRLYGLVRLRRFHDATVQSSGAQFAAHPSSPRHRSIRSTLGFAAAWEDVRGTSASALVQSGRDRFLPGWLRLPSRRRQSSPAPFATKRAARCRVCRSSSVRRPASPLLAVTDGQGAFRFDRVAAGRYQAAFTLINFAEHASGGRRHRRRGPCGSTSVLHLSLSADVTVTGKRTFANLADVENPAENLVGIAAVREPGGDHGATARRPADHASRRGPGNRPRRGHQSAQRRRQSQPVLPARIQSRSRNRLRDHGRRHAGQHAHACAWARLLRSQLSDSRSW